MTRENRGVDGEAPALASWIGVGLLVAAVLALRPLYLSTMHPAVAFGLAGLGAALLLRGAGLRRGLPLLVTTLLAAHLCDAAYSANEAWSHGASRSVAVLIHALLPRLYDGSGVVDDRLLVMDQRQLTVLVASGSLVGLRETLVTGAVVLVLCLALGLHAKRGAIVTVLLGVLAITTMRTALGLARFMEAGQRGQDERHHDLAEMWQPGLAMIGIIGLVLVMAVQIEGRIEGRGRAVAAGAKAVVGRGAAAIALGLLIGFGLLLRSSGAPKAGRVLVDDRFSGVWEPAARLLDRNRYGDFSTYSFASLVEQLAHRYAVTVNVDELYTRQLLDAYDVFILKTPQEPLLAEEVAAIQAWTRDGGGLFVVGDHTDLTGMNTFLNDVARDLGVWFRNDAIDQVDQPGFVTWQDPLLSSHPITAGMAPFGLMTACSVMGDAGIEPVMALERVATIQGDYGNWSNFGSVPPQPKDQQGRALAAAAVEVGRGRVLAFGDSTVLSSFAVFVDSHAEFVERCVAWLNSDARPAWGRWIAACLGLLTVVIGLRTIQGDERLVAMPAFLGGMLLGAVAGGKLSGALLFVPREWADVQKVAIVAEGGRAILPPVLGTQPEGLDDQNFMTFAQVPLRLGMEIEILPRSASRLADFSALVVLNPDAERDPEGMPADWVEGVRRWVESGGRLIVLAQGAHRSCEHARLDAYRFGATFHRAALGSSALKAEHARFGKGSILVAWPSERLSVQGMGHCMSLPGAEQRARYESAYALFDCLGLGVPEKQRRIYFPSTQSAGGAMASRPRDP